MSIKAYKYRIYANKQTTEKLHWVLDRCRELYNAGLQERRDAYEIGVKRHPAYYDEEARRQLTREHAIGYYEQKRELVDVKEVRPEYQEIASHVLQDVILRLKHAFDSFFRRVQNGEQPGYPRFQGRNRYGSFCYPDGAGWKLDAQTRLGDKKGIIRVNLKLTKIGTVKLHLHRNMVGTIKTLTIKREGEHFYAIFTCEIGELEPLPTSYEDVGIDLGVTHFAALVRRPKPKQDAETGHYLPNGASAKAGLNKSIVDAGWSQFVEMCTYKAAYAGRTLLKVDPRYTSQICPNCGTQRKKTLEERWHSCECGCELDRDTASAKVILDVGRQQLLVGTRPTRATA